MERMGKGWGMGETAERPECLPGPTRWRAEGWGRARVHGGHGLCRKRPKVKRLACSRNLYKFRIVGAKGSQHLQWNQSTLLLWGWGGWSTLVPGLGSSLDPGKSLLITF